MENIETLNTLIVTLSAELKTAEVAAEVAAIDGTEAEQIEANDLAVKAAKALKSAKAKLSKARKAASLKNTETVVSAHLAKNLAVQGEGFQSVTKPNDIMYQVGRFTISASVLAVARGAVTALRDANARFTILADELHAIGVTSEDFDDSEFKDGIYENVLIHQLSSEELTIYRLKPGTLSSDGKRTLVFIKSILSTGYAKMRAALAKAEALASLAEQDNPQHKRADFAERVIKALDKLSDQIKKHEFKKDERTFSTVAVLEAIAEARSYL